MVWRGSQDQHEIHLMNLDLLVLLSRWGIRCNRFMIEGECQKLSVSSEALGAAECNTYKDGSEFPAKLEKRIRVSVCGHCAWLMDRGCCSRSHWHAVAANQRSRSRRISYSDVLVASRAGPQPNRTTSAHDEAEHAVWCDGRHYKHRSR